MSMILAFYFITVPRLAPPPPIIVPPFRLPALRATPVSLRK